MEEIILIYKRAQDSERFTCGRAYQMLELKANKVLVMDNLGSKVWKAFSSFRTFN